MAPVSVPAGFRPATRPVSAGRGHPLHGGLQRAGVSRLSYGSRGRRPRRRREGAGHVGQDQAPVPTLLLTKA